MGSLYAKLPSNSPMRYVLATIVIAVLLVAMWLVRGVLMLALASIIIVVLLDMPIYYLVRRGLNRGLATLISLIIVVLSVSVLFSLMLPTLVTQFTTLATVTVPQGIERLVKYIRVTEQALGDGVKHVYESEKSSLSKLRRFSQ